MGVLLHRTANLLKKRQYLIHALSLFPMKTCWDTTTMIAICSMLCPTMKSIFAHVMEDQSSPPLCIKLDLSIYADASNIYFVVGIFGFDCLLICAGDSKPISINTQPSLNLYLQERLVSLKRSNE